MSTLNLPRVRTSIRGDASSAVRSPLDQVPNALTVLRIALVPVVAVLLLRDQRTASVLAGVVFGAAAATDQLDGFLARKWRAESPFGRRFDVVADRLMIWTTLALLAATGRLPWWGLLVLIVREISIGVARVLMPPGFVFGVSRAGKATAWVLYGSLLALVVCPQAETWPRFVFYGGLLLAVASGAGYVLTGRRLRNGSTEGTRT